MVIWEQYEYIKPFKIMIKVYDLDSIIDFGRFIGRPILHYLKHDPGWINWCLTNKNDFLLSQEAEDYYDSFWKATPYHYRLANGCEDTAGIIHDKVLASRIRGNMMFVESTLGITVGSPNVNEDDSLKEDIDHEMRGMNEESGGSLNWNID